MTTTEDRRQQLYASLTNQPPRDESIVDRFEKVREAAKALGDAILDHAPDTRERSLALTHLEESVMWAVKAIALNQDLLPTYVVA